MIYVFFTLVGLGIFHLFYESVIAPSMRLTLRWNLFEIRDDLRLLKMDEPDLLPDQVYNYLQDCVNNSLNILHRVNFSLIWEIDREIETNQHLKERVEKRIKLIDSSDKKVVELRARINEIGRKALLINTGAWMLYLIPAIVILASLDKLVSMVTEIVALPSHELETYDELISVAW